MTDKRDSTLAQSLAPSLLITDMPHTLGFYEALGFQLDGVFPDRINATWARVRFGDIALMFYTDPPYGTAAEPICSGTFYVECADVASLAERWGSVIPFAWGPEKMPYGTYEFGIKDPDGYHIAFAGRVEP